MKASKNFKNLFTALALLLCGCGDFFTPVESTPAPTEYTYNYWLLERLYLFEDELSNLNAEGDSVQVLYSALTDPYTRYVAPSKSEATETAINTSIVSGNVGMEYAFDGTQEYPLFIYRVYPQSPAALAGVPRYGTILAINGTELKMGDSVNTAQKVYSVYDSVLSYNREIELRIAYGGDTATYKMEKADIYAPTVFVDSVGGTEIIRITGFKQTTLDRENGTLGELRAHLDSTASTTATRILDLRSNPGGLVSQCIPMADLFIESGTIITESWRTFTGDGTAVKRSKAYMSTRGDSGEKGNFVVLVNGNSASCSEIFTIAISEGAHIPVIGSTTYGKGIGQSTWSTMAGGLAIITNIEFLSPNGNSYHKKGIVPDVVCDAGATIQCALDAIQDGSAKSLAKQSPSEVITPSAGDIGGAIVEGESLQ